MKSSKLTLGMLVALVTGNIIGSGAFLLPADLAKFGSIGILSLLATSIGAIALSLIFARMITLVSQNGGPHVFIAAGLGETLGIQMAYAYWLAIWIGNAAIVVAALGYLNLIIPVLGNLWVKNLASMFIVWSLTLVNLRGIKTVGWVQIVTTILKFIPLVIVFVGGWSYFHPEWLKLTFNVSGQSNWWAFSHGLIFTMWLFIGLESATIPVSEAQHPERDIPIATVLGTILATLVYIGSTLIVFGMIPHGTLVQTNAPFALASELILGSWGKWLVAFGALIACLGALNGWILVSAQIPIAAAKKGIFPEIFGKINEQGTPGVAIIINSLCISALLLVSSTLNLLNQFDFLILLATTISVLAYFYTALSHWKLSLTYLKQHWGWGIINILALGYSLFALIHSGTWILLGLVGGSLITLWLIRLIKK